MQGKPFNRRDKRDEHFRKKHLMLNNLGSGAATPSSGSSDDLDLELNSPATEPADPRIEFPSQSHDLVQAANVLCNTALASGSLNFQTQGEHAPDILGLACDSALADYGSFSDLANGLVADTQVPSLKAWDLADQFGPSLFAAPIAEDVNVLDNNMFADVAGGIELYQSIITDTNAIKETAAAAAQAPFITDATRLQPVMPPWNLGGNNGDAISLVGSQGSNRGFGLSGSIRCQHCGNHVL